MKNRDRIKAMSDDDLAFILMCPYDTYGSGGYDELPCVKDEAICGMPDEKYCHGCLKAWLDKEAE